MWNTDSNGNYISNLIGIVSGTSTTLESLETGFHQDLNGDGVIGIPGAAVIEAVGSTSLVEVGNNYFLNSISSGIGPELKYGGAPFAAGQFGGWSPIGAEQTSTGYEVAWKVTGADQYTVWNTDSNGNYISNPIGICVGNQHRAGIAGDQFPSGFERRRRDRHSRPTVIEAFGSTSLVEVGNNYFLDSISSGTGPELKLWRRAFCGGSVWGLDADRRGADVNGYEVAWKVAGADQYTVWNTDSNGNYISNPIGIVSGTSTTLESLETSFHQDLNGDGVIGIPATTVIEAFGSTSLVEVGNNYYLNSISSGIGPELKYGGAPFAAGQFGAWTPIGAEQTATRIRGRLEGHGRRSVFGRGLPTATATTSQI